MEPLFSWLWNHFNILLELFWNIVLLIFRWLLKYSRMIIGRCLHAVRFFDGVRMISRWYSDYLGMLFRTILDGFPRKKSGKYFHQKVANMICQKKWKHPVFPTKRGENTSLCRLWMSKNNMARGGSAGGGPPGTAPSVFFLSGICFSQNYTILKVNNKSKKFLESSLRINIMIKIYFYATCSYLQNNILSY